MAGWATVLALEGGRRTRVVGVAALVLLATLLRSEAVLFGLGLGAGLGLVAVLRRDRTLVAPAVAAGVAAIVGRFVDGALASVVASGSGSINPVAAEGGSFLGSRLAGAVVTWVLPSYDGVGPDDLLLVGVVLFGVAAVVVARRHPEDGSGVRLFAVLAAACGVAHLALPAGAVPGLLVAFPVLAVGLAGIDRRLLADRTAVVLAATYVAYVGAVLATQYSSGGSGEWGGRYFTLGLPLIVPLVLAGLAAVGDRLDEGTRRVATGALVVLAATTTLGAALALHDHQAMTARTVALVEDAVAATPDTVVVATDGTTGRFAWREVVGGADWLLVEDESRLAEVGEALAATGRPVVVSTYDADAYLDDLAPWYRVVGEERPEAGSSRVVVRLAPR